MFTGIQSNVFCDEIKYFCDEMGFSLKNLSFKELEEKTPQIFIYVCRPLQVANSRWQSVLKHVKAFMCWSSNCLIRVCRQTLARCGMSLTVGPQGGQIVQGKNLLARQLLPLDHTHYYPSTTATIPSHCSVSLLYFLMCASFLLFFIFFEKQVLQL